MAPFTEAAGAIASFVSTYTALRAFVNASYLPDPSLGWKQTPSAAVVVTAASIVFVSMFLIERGFRLALSAAFSNHTVLREKRARHILARMAYTTLALVYISYMGYSMCLDLQWAPPDKRTYAYIPYVLPPTAHGRVYSYLPKFAWTCVAMGAFQTKNLLDSIIFGDGPEFIMHHLVCIFVAYGALSGQFLHLYGIFFFGLSEASTALVSVLACFDEKLGVPELGDEHPLLKITCGISFAVSFIAIRIVVWPYLAYCLTLDCLQVLKEGSSHSEVIVWSFLACLLALTLLQFFWLAEIVRQARIEIPAALGYGAAPAQAAKKSK